MDPLATGHGSFPPTAWTLLAGIAEGGSKRDRALASIASRYWMPVYVYLRRKGKAREDAEDLVHVLIRVWDLPEDVPIKTACGAFDRKTWFEKDVPLD